MLGYGPEDKSTVLELTYNYGVTEYDKGKLLLQGHAFHAKVHRSHILANYELASCKIKLIWNLN